MTWQLDHAKAEDWLPTIADQSVDLVLVDPPYFRVKDEPWDRQWDTAAGFLAWLDSLAVEWQRVLRPNGSLYVFASPQMAARVEVQTAERFNVLNNIRWYKAEGWHKKACAEDLRSYLTPWEAVIFAEQAGSDAGELAYLSACDAIRGEVLRPLWEYLEGERKRAGVSRAECNGACGFAPVAGAMAARKYFGPSQFCLPTERHYESLRARFNRDGGDFLAKGYGVLLGEYVVLAQEYERRRKPIDDRRRPFALRDLAVDRWTFPTVQPYPGKHVCEKPLALLRHIISASTREGAVVLDCFAGSGNTGVAARQLGRHFLGCEASAVWHTKGGRRIEHAALQVALPLEVAS